MEWGKRKGCHRTSTYRICAVDWTVVLLAVGGNPQGGAGLGDVQAQFRMCWPGDVYGPPKGRWLAGCCVNGPGAQEKSGLETDLMLNMSQE